MAARSTAEVGLHLELDAATKARLRAWARMDGRTLSEHVRRILREALKTYDSRKKT